MLAQRLRMPRLLDLVFIVGMTLQGWGNALRLFENVYLWDNLVHLSIPVLERAGALRAELASGPAARHLRNDPAASPARLVLFATMSGLSIGALYEIYEYVALHWPDAGLAIGYSYTIFELTLDAAGSFAGGVLLRLWADRALGYRTQPGTSPHIGHRAILCRPGSLQGWITPSGRAQLEQRVRPARDSDCVRPSNVSSHEIVRR